MKVYIITEIDHSNDGYLNIAGVYHSHLVASLQLQRLINKSDEDNKLCDYDLFEEEVI